MSTTRHAHTRAQQRGVPPLIDQWLDAYGEEEYDGHGGIVRYFSSRSLRAMERDFGRAPVAQLMASYHDCYKVQGREGQAITFGRRYRHIHRK